MLAAGCAASDADETLGAVEQGAQPIDRLLIGKAAMYPADKSMRARLPVLDASMVERRKEAWAIVQKIVAPVTIASKSSSAPHAALARLPRFQTWYSRDDVLPMFDRLFRALPDADKKAHARFGEHAIAGVFPWNATMAPSLASYTEERRAARLRELATPAGLHSLGKDARVLMSPSYVGHVLRSYPEIAACQVPREQEDPPSATNFAPCLDGELPIDAAAVKMRWIAGSSPMPTYDTSPSSLAAKLAAGKFGDGDGHASPDENDIYTMQLTPDTSMRLAALHIMTKELRDWAWITLWWSSEPDTDFGADRPASLGSPWGHYKMCVVTSYEEKDMAARMDAADPSSWCSNPYLEQGEHAAKTSCIGCHQHGGTAETTESILAAPERFPRGGRTKVRKNFPADYAFTTSAGLDLAAEIRAKIDALTPW
ncbi:MAG: hypothetical protein JWP87_5841 [Labilithrix sp.]|nr:hypothetical protein [Labilithrix sp.]